MNTKTKFIISFLALILIFSFALAACSGGSEASSTTEKNEEEEIIENVAEEEIVEETITKEEAERNPTIKISSIAGYDVSDNKIEFEDNILKGDVDLIVVTLKTSNFDVERDSVVVVWELEGVEICRISEIIKKNINTYLTGVSIAEINTYRSLKGTSASKVFYFLPSGGYRCIATLYWLTAELQEIRITTDVREFKIERGVEEEIAGAEDNDQVKKEELKEESNDSTYNNEEEILNQIMEKAKSDWPNDYDMQNYQYNNQVNAYHELKDLPNTENYRQEILSKAQVDWPNDYEMQLYQYKNQLEAYNEIKGLPNTGNYRDEILSKARRDWPNDYEMQLYQYNNQLEAYLEIQQLPYTSNFNRSALIRAQRDWPDDYEMQLYQYNND